MKRATSRIVLFLVLGAIINVAVAWTYAVAFDIYPRHLKWIESLGFTYVNRQADGIIEWKCGFPCRSLECHWHVDGYKTIKGCSTWEVPSPLPESLKFKGDDSSLPLHPIRLGFAVNSIFYGVILRLLTFGSFVLCRFNRHKRGLCTKCGYDLRHADHLVCPECGATP